MGAIKAVDGLMQDSIEAGAYEVFSTTRDAVVYLRRWDELASVIQRVEGHRGRTLLGATVDDMDGREVVGFIADHERSEAPISHNINASHLVKLPEGARVEDVADGLGGYARKAGEFIWR